MKILLDTCTFLWLANAANELSEKAINAFKDPANEIYLSVISVWEIAIKHSLNKLPLPEPPEVFVPTRRSKMGIESLELCENACLHLSKLGSWHNDPFDRMLVAQAIEHGMQILSQDSEIAKYPVKVLW